MSSVKDLSQKLWDCQVELRNLIKQDQPPLHFEADRDDVGIYPKEPEPEPEPEVGTVGAPEPETPVDKRQPKTKPRSVSSMFKQKPQRSPYVLR